MKNEFTICLIFFLLVLMSVQGATGLTLETNEKTSSQIEKQDASNLPSYFSWRDRDGVDYTTPIRNQAPYASCETFAITAALETMVQSKVGYPFGCDLSEAHLYFYSGGNLDWGSYPENDTKFLVEYGIPDEACWPYPKVRKKFPLNTTSPDWQDRTVKIKDWWYLPEDPVAIKHAIVNNGPVPTYFMSYKDFVYHKQGIYEHKWGKIHGPHYVTIVGYNDDPGYWICKNSWGTNVQENGWFKIKYGECSIEKKSFYLSGVYGRFPINYVDDDNILGPWNGTKQYPYQTIQEAIDQSYEGYTIYVLNGTYHENLIINKTINLDGKNKSTTIIDGSKDGHVIEISAPKVRISGFTIQNSGNLPYDAGIKTLSLKSNVTIRNNIIQNSDIGIFLNYAYSTAWNIVENNIIQNNRDGISIHHAYNNKISGNTITKNTDDGIEMEVTKKSTITDNLISDNGGCGLFLRSISNENTINEKNIIKNNSIGIKLDTSYINIITGNNFINNNIQAIFDNSLLNRWNKNYWDDWSKRIPRLIHGTIGTREIPWINIDWLPSKQPI